MVVVGASVVVVVVVTAGTLYPSFCFGLQSRITADRVNSNRAITAALPRAFSSEHVATERILAIMTLSWQNLLLLLVPYLNR